MRLVDPKQQSVCHAPKHILGLLLYWAPMGQKVGAKSYGFSMSAFGIEPHQYRYPYQELY